MRTLFFCPRWGSEHLDWDTFSQRVKIAGYDGVEYAIHNDTPTAELDLVWSKLEQYGLEVITQHYSTNDADFDTHYRAFQQWFEKLAAYPVLRINSQTGKDYFSYEQNQQLIELANVQGKKRSVEVLHETHRGKFSFAAHITYPFLKQMVDLKLTLDASHWVNVAESYLEDQTAAIALAVSRTEHIHARVGYPEGPQIPDPRDERWQEALGRHLNWWDRVAERKAAGSSLLTITPEFGPAPYMVHLPGSSMPIADQWEINLFMKNFLQERYA